MIDPRYSDLFDRSAIPLDFAEKLGVYSIETDDELPSEFADWAGEGATPALVFPHPSAVDGSITWQLRPDTPVITRDGDSRKYLWPKGSPLVFTVHEDARIRLASPNSTVLLVEGTKQTIAAAAWAPAEIAVVGVGGIWGHRDRKVGLLADIAGLRLGKRKVVIVPDADYEINAAVWEGLRDLVRVFEPLTSGKVNVAPLPGGASTGLDDYLGMIGPDQRTDAIGTLVEKSGSGKRIGPRPKSTDTFADPGKAVVRVSSFADDLVRTFGDRLVVDELSGELLVDEGGVWTPVREAAATLAYLLDGLGEHYSDPGLRRVVELAARRLRLDGRVLTEWDTPPIVAFRNGIVRLDGVGRLKLQPFDGQPPARIRFPIDWDDEAEAPLYSAWIEEMTAGEDDPLLLAEVLGQLFDTSRPPERHLLLYGPSRSGKSTLQRLAEAMLDERNRSHVPLAALTEHRFAAIQLRYSRLNSVADLSSASIRDLAGFKAATGGDRMMVEAKNKDPIVIRAQAVQLFSVNAIPALGEESRALLNRIVPVAFPTTFEGREDPSIEAAMMAELPAIAGIWLEQHAARTRIGRWTPPTPEAARDFELASNRVREFLEERTKPGIWTSRAEVYDAYADWSRRNGYTPKGADKFYLACESAGVGSRKVRGDRQISVGIVR